MKSSTTHLKKVFTILIIFLSSQYIANAQADLDLKLFIQGYYTGLNSMRPVLLNQGVGFNASECDSIIINLLDTSTYSIVESAHVIFLVNGTCHVTFSNAVVGNYYFIDLCHRNSIQTMSASPVLFSSSTSYDFTTGASQAYGNKMKLVGPNQWAVYNGDLNKDCLVNFADSIILDIDVQNGNGGYYCTDLNGDGAVDIDDFNSVETNFANNISCAFPGPIPPCASCGGPCANIITSDGDACTFDYCDPFTLIVSHTPINPDDGNACTVDYCNSSSGVSNTYLNYDDGNPCTIDDCNTLTGAISHTNSCVQLSITCPPDIYICFNLPDADVNLGEVTVNSSNGIPSIQHNSPATFPIGTTDIIWTVTDTLGFASTCIQHVIRNAEVTTVAQFTTVPAAQSNIIHICLGQPVYFLDQSTGFTSWNWNFGDGFISTENNPVHTFNFAGTFTVSLTLSNACGINENFTSIVQVDPESGPDIYCPSVVCAHDTVVYSTSAVCSQYIWTVTGGTIISFPANANSIMVAWGDGSGGDGTITLDIPGCAAFCNRPSIRLIPILPSTIPVTGEIIVCPGNTTVYEVPCIPATNYTWSVGSQGSIIDGQGTHQVTVYWSPLASGPAVINVNYQNNLAMCSGNGILNVMILPLLGISGPEKLCPGFTNGSAPFNAFYSLTLAGANVNWSVITPANTTLSNLQTNSSVFDNYNWNAGPGIYTVIATVLPGVFCNTSISKTVEVVNELPVPGPITGKSMICPNTAYTYSVTPNMTNVDYLWTITGGTPSTANGIVVSITWGNTGPYKISLKQQLANSPYCLSGETILTVTPFPPLSIPTISGPAPVCKKNVSIYSLSGSLNPDAAYTWSVIPADAGNIISANGSNSVTIDWSGTNNTTVNATVRLTISLCGDHIINYPVTVNSLPEPEIISPVLICVDQPVQFNGSAGFTSWSWVFGDPTSGANTSTDQNPFHTFSQSGNFTVTLNVTDGFNCSGTSVANIVVNPKPVVPIITGSPLVCASSVSVYSFAQPMLPGATYKWSLSPASAGSITSSDNSDNITVQWNSFLSTTPVNILLDVTSTCLNVQQIYNVTIEPLPIPVITTGHPACVNSPISFNGSAGISWQWDFGDPLSGINNSSISQTPSHTYFSTGTQIITLSLTDAFGCSASTSTLVNIKPLPVASISTGDATSFCPSTNVSATLYALSGTLYTYDWIGGGTSNLYPNQRFVNQVGTYSVVVHNSFGCTSTSNTITLTQLSSCAGGTGGDPVCNPDFGFTSTVDCDLGTFNQTGGSPSNLSWNFGDGSSTVATNTSHAYSLPGFYKVALSGPGTLSPGGGPCPATVVQAIEIPIKADFFYEFKCSAGGVVLADLTDISLSSNLNIINVWEWYLPGNLSATPDFTGQNFLNVPLSPGINSIKLVVKSTTNKTCTVVKNIFVPTPVAADFNYSSQLCQGTQIVFTDNSSVPLISRLWDFNNNGSSTSTATNPGYIYLIPGTKTVRYEVTDNIGCKSISTKSFDILPSGSGIITANGPTEFCEGESVELIAPAGTNYLWSTPLPDITPTITVSQGGSYTVIVTGINGCSFITPPISVTVNPLPVAVITGKSTYCQGEFLSLSTTSGSYSYVWEFDANPIDGNYLIVGGSTSSLQYVINNSSASGNYRVKVTNTSTNCMDTSLPFMVTVYDVPSSPVISASGPLIFCDGDSVTLTAPSGASYMWSTNSTASFIKIKQSGTYSVVVKTADGCPFSPPSVVVIVNPLPPALIQGKNVYCELETIELNSVPGYSYQWKFDDVPFNNIYMNVGLDNSDLQITNITTTLSGNYRVVVTDLITGCSSSSANYPIVVNPVPAIPAVTANASLPLCEGHQYLLTINNPEPNVTYDWNTGQTGTVIPVANANEYIVTAENQFGCISVSDKISIYPSPDLNCVPSGCFQFCDSLLPFTVTGPDGFSNYQWQVLGGGGFITIAITKDLVVTANGLYRLVVINSFGCTATSETLEMNFIDCGHCTLSGFISTKVDVGCHGGNNGTATVSVSGGTGPFAYLWSNGETSSTAIHLTSGTSSVTVRDALGCIVRVFVDLSEPTVLSASATPGIISCYGETTCITVTASGGTPSYSGTGIFCGYTSGGPYNFDVTDHNGCIVTASVSIIGPPKLVLTITNTPADCGLNNGTATGFPGGGIPLYTYNWSNTQTTQTATGLVAGQTYTVTITDSHGCTKTGSTVIQSSGSTPATPGTINGPSGACKGQSGVIYCVDSIPGATTYIWTLPTGASGTSTGPCITLKFSTKFKGGYVCVKTMSACGTSANSCRNIVVIGGKPVTPGTISGPSPACVNGTATYSIAAIANATSYVWAVTGGLSISTGQGSTSLVVNIPPGFTSGTISVKAVNCKGSSGSRKITITGTLCGVNLGNQVWDDTNNNGFKDGGESGVYGLTVKLYNDANNDNVPDGAAISTTTTNANGIYGFSALLNNNFIVGVLIPAGGSLEAINGGDPDNNIDNDNNGLAIVSSEARSNSISLALGTEPTSDGDGINGNLTVDFALHMPLNPPPIKICYIGIVHNFVLATQEWTVNTALNTVTIRTTFSKNFVDNTYGINAIGWPSGHTFSQLLGSDHLQTALYDANNVKIMEFKLDYVTASTSVPSGYKSLGVTGGEGSMLVGNLNDVLSCVTSIDKNFNTYGYVLNSVSPATNSSYTPNVSYPDWIYDVWYEVSVKLSAFGTAGFGRPVITAIHASPSKTGSNTELMVDTICTYLYPRMASTISFGTNDQEANAFPNPFSDNITIDISSPLYDDAEIIITDVAGKIVESFTHVHGTIEAGHNFKPGIYFVYISQGDRSGKIKIVKMN